MVAYPIDEAKSLLTQKLSSQETNMKTCQEDLEFLREQITTMEVNIGIPIILHSQLIPARTYNWDVKRRRQTQRTTIEDASDE
jgi:Prefoldin subunit